MNINKKQLVYLGIGAFFGLIIYNSIRQDKLKEVKDSSTNKENFTTDSLPSNLKPPYRLMEGEQLPNTSVPKKNFNSMLGIKNSF
jgi:hypothetical protein